MNPQRVVLGQAGGELVQRRLNGFFRQREPIGAGARKTRKAFYDKMRKLIARVSEVVLLNTQMIERGAIS
ncbi:hypothetical protein ABLN64_01335, partial [Mycobacterium tuberculosis]